MRISDWSSDVCSSDLANPPPFAKGVGADATPIQASPDPDAHVIAVVFRIVNDPFVGKLGVFRVYQATVKKDSQLFVDDGKKPFKVAHLRSEAHTSELQSLMRIAYAVFCLKHNTIRYDIVYHM